MECERCRGEHTLFVGTSTMTTTCGARVVLRWLRKEIGRTSDQDEMNLYCLAQASNRNCLYAEARKKKVESTRRAPGSGRWKFIAKDYHRARDSLSDGRGG